MKIKKTLAVLAVITLFGVTSATAYAAEDTTSNLDKNRQRISSEQRIEMKSRMNEYLDQALAKGKITQEQYDVKINDSRNDKMPGFGGQGFKEKMDNLTDEQKAEIQSKMEEHLTQALAEGKITQEQYDTRINDFKNGQMPGRGGFGFMGKMSGFSDRGFKNKISNIADKEKTDFAGLKDVKGM